MSEQGGGIDLAAAATRAQASAVVPGAPPSCDRTGRISWEDPDPAAANAGIVSSAGQWFKRNFGIVVF